MKRYIIIFLSIILLINFFIPHTVYAEENIDSNIEELLSHLDMQELDDYFSSLSKDQKDVFGGSIQDYIVKVIHGEINFEDNVNTFLRLLGLSIKENITNIITILSIIILSAMMNAIKGNFSSISIENVITFACITIISMIVLLSSFNIIKSGIGLINNMKKQCDIIFPLLITLMASIGSKTSIAVFQPAVAIFSISLINVIIVLVIPIIFISLILSTIGNLSDNVKLSGLTNAFSSINKWILGTSYFLFLGFLSLKGITASIYDNITVRTVKFAMSKYVPIIGGYLSEGVNLVISGSILIKNAIGLTAILLLIVVALPVIINSIIFQLSLKICSGIAEPICDNKICKLLNGVSSSISIFCAALIGLIFLYFIFVIMVVCMGNLIV